MARKEKKEAKIEIKVWQPYLLIYTHLWYHHTHAASKIDKKDLKIKHFKGRGMK